MRITIKALLLSVSIVAFSSVTTRADEIDNFVQDAINNKTFYHYNIAYKKILGLEDKERQKKLLDELDKISEAVWTEDIKKYNLLLTRLFESKGSGRVYDEIINTIESATLKDTDKNYLLGELTSWGKGLTWTEDYKTAVNDILNCWSWFSNKESDLESRILQAEKGINAVYNVDSREYLKEQLTNIKERYDKEYIRIKSVPTTNMIIYVKHGVEFSALDLPRSIKVTLTNNKELDLPVKWTSVDYVKSKLGTYEAIADYDLPNGVYGIKPKISYFIIVNRSANDYNVELLSYKGNIEGPVTIKVKEYDTYGTLDSAYPSCIDGDLILDMSDMQKNQQLTLNNIKISGSLIINAGFGEIYLNNITADRIETSNKGTSYLILKGNTEIGTLAHTVKDNPLNIKLFDNSTISKIEAQYGFTLDSSESAKMVNMILLKNDLYEEFNIKGQINIVSSKGPCDINLLGKGTIIDSLSVSGNSNITLNDSSNISNLSITDVNDVKVSKQNSKITTKVNIKGSTNLTMINGTAEVSSDEETLVYIDIKGDGMVIIYSDNYSIKTSDKAIVTRRQTNIKP